MWYGSNLLPLLPGVVHPFVEQRPEHYLPTRSKLLSLNPERESNPLNTLQGGPGEPAVFATFY